MFIRRKTLKAILNHCYACSDIVEELNERVEKLESDLREIKLNENLKKLTKTEPIK